MEECGSGQHSELHVQCVCHDTGSTASTPQSSRGQTHSLTCPGRCTQVYTVAPSPPVCVCVCV